MNSQTVRLNALKLAAEGSTETAENVVERAEAYLKFLTADDLKLPRNLPDKTQGGNVRQYADHQSIRELAEGKIASAGPDAGEGDKP